jgi:aminopeptidase
MRDPRYTKLAQNLIRHSVAIQPGEKVLINTFDNEIPLTREIIRAVYEAGGMPFLKLCNSELFRELRLGTTKEHAETMGLIEKYEIDRMDAFVQVIKLDNVNWASNTPPEKQRIWGEHYARHTRVTHLKWVTMRYPNESMAQLAGMSTEEFEDFFFEVCTVDYAKMTEAIQPLVELMKRTDRVRITGPGTDLTFSIKGQAVIPCTGQNNIPDGEVFTSPLIRSVNGVLTYNTPSVYHGTTFENVRLVFQDGKIVEATANDTEKLHAVLDTDPGARYIGEFAIGFNPYILEPMLDTLFDEKIAGSFHFTPGNAYEEADNGNRSAVHWDLVSIQRPEYGGGEIWFDDVLIRKDGWFVLPELEGLNPENLK